MSGEKLTPPKDIDNTFRGNDPRTIEIDNPTECAYWVKALDVSEDVLRAAVQLVGPSAQKVKDYLQRFGSS